MFQQMALQKLDEYFLPLSARRGGAVYFYRISAYDASVQAFIEKYYDQARRSGVVLKGKIPNPDERNLQYYNEILGQSFALSSDFIAKSLRRWLPRMNDRQHNAVSSALFSALEDMQREGKNLNMLKNAYIKMMCWLYYKFERITNQLGGDQLPKILYEGTVNQYELRLLTILSRAGADIVLLQLQGDGAYHKLDPGSMYSRAYTAAGLGPFPEGFNLRKIQDALKKQLANQRLYGQLPKRECCTNAWIEGKGFADVLTDVPARGSDPRFFYNCLVRMTGVEDKVTYLNELYQLYLSLKGRQRPVCILEQGVQPPTPAEIAEIKRKNYANSEQMILDLAGNLPAVPDAELRLLLRKAFVEAMLAEAEQESNLNKLTAHGVHLLCWLRRYVRDLFSGWRADNVSAFILLGGCRKKREADLLCLLSKLPVDILILAPDRGEQCCFTHPSLFELQFEGSLAVERFPTEQAQIRVGTAAYHAERELDELMYRDSGIYRNHQYGKAMSITLQTMYEEIAILWDTELKYRPNFNVVNDVVSLPVIFSKISGVKERRETLYWGEIKKLLTPDVFFIGKAPFLSSTAPNPIKAHTTQFLKNRRLQREKIFSHPAYPYAVLRPEMQEHLLSKMQLLLDQRLIRGTYENGTEYTVLATVLSLNKELIRLIQNFDFTKKNPKLIYVNTTEETISLEDSILTAFLNLVGFDVLFFVPTGYQSIERYFNSRPAEEHQIGEYLYDLTAPDLKESRSASRLSWREKLFGRDV